MACETFHPLRSELKEAAPENIPVYKDIDLKKQKNYKIYYGCKKRKLLVIYIITYKVFDTRDIPLAYV